MRKYDGYYAEAGRFVVLKTSDDLYTFLFESNSGKINDWDTYPAFTSIFNHKKEEVSKVLGLNIAKKKLFVEAIKKAPGIEVPFPQINGIKFVDPWNGKFEVSNYSIDVKSKELGRELIKYLTTALVLGLEIKLSGWNEKKQQELYNQAVDNASKYYELTTPKEMEEKPKEYKKEIKK